MFISIKLVIMTTIMNIQSQNAVSPLLRLIHPELLEDDSNFITNITDSPAELENINLLLDDKEHLKAQVEKDKTKTIVTPTFEYIKDRYSREMLLNAWEAINLTEMWGFVKQDIESFTWSIEPEVTIIMDKMVSLGYRGHSGASFGCTMRAMQYLAQNGEEKFKELYI